MATDYTTLLGFALPATGELSGTWGTTVNNSITELVEDAIAASATASVTSADWTLSTTGAGSVNQARCAILIPTGTPGVTRNINAPNASKAYIVINQSNAAVVIRGATGPTTGVSIAASAKALVVWTGSDFTAVSDYPINISSGSADITGTLAVGNGGSGATTAQGAMNTFAGAVTTGQYLRGNGTNVLMSAIQAGDVPTLNQNTTGSAATLTTARTLTVGATGKTFNGSANVSWTLTEIGAAASGANTDITALDQDITITATGTIAADTIGYRGIPVNSKTSAYQLDLPDASKFIRITTGGITIPANGTTAFPIGTVITVYNDSASSQNITITTDTLRLAGTATTGTRAVAQRGIATLLKVNTTEWVASGVGVT